MTQNEPTTHEIETTTESGTEVEIKVRYGTANVTTENPYYHGRTKSVDEKGGRKVLDLGLHSGEQIYVPVDDETADEIEAAMEDTEDEDALDYESENNDKWYEGPAPADGEMYDWDDGHVAADNE